MSRLRLAWIQLRSQIGQLATAVVVIALGVALAAGMMLANAALRESFLESVDALAGRAELEVSPLSGGTLDEAVLDQVRGVAGVAAAAPLLLGSAFVEGEKSVRVRVVGVDMLDDSTVRLYRSTPGEAAGIEDPLVFLSQPDSAIAPASFVRRRGLDRGAALELHTPVGRRRVVIRGIIEDTGVGRAFGGDLVIMDLFAAQEIMGMPGRISQIDVAAASGVSPEELARRLRDALPVHIGIERVSVRKAQLGRTLAGFQVMLNVISTMGLLLGGLITANRLTTVYQERLWEMGVLRGLGWTPGSLLRDLLIEALLVSAVAVAVGLPLGVLFAQLIIGSVGDTMALSFKQLQQLQIPSVALRAGPLALAGLVGIVSGVTAAWVPALRASRASIASLKAMRRRREPEAETPWRRRARLLVPTAAVGMLSVQVATGSGVVGAVAMVLIAMAGGLLIQPGLRAMSVPVGRLLGEAAQVGARDQSRAPSRAIGAAGILMTGIALVVWIGNTGQSFEKFVVGSLMKIRHGDLIVDSAFNEDVGAVGENEPRLSEAILAELEKIPGVEAVGADVSARVLSPETGIIAVDRSRLLVGKFGAWRLQPGAEPNALERVARGEAVLADETFVSNHRARVGRVVTVVTPSGRLERPIVGIIAPSFQSPAGDIVLSRELYRTYWRDPTVTRIFVLVAPQVRVSDVRRLIVDGMGDRYRLRVTDAAQLSDWFSESVRGAFSFLDGMAILTILVVLVGTADGLAANVVERTREIGTLRAIGYSPGSIAVMVLAQALAIGIVGAGLAVVLGMGMSVAFVEGVLQAILGWQLEVYPTWGAAAAAAGLGILACVVGGLVPAIRAARLSVAKALRYE